MKTWIRKAIYLLCIYGVLFAILFFSKEISHGIQNGIDTCISLVIPSTFLFLILSDLLSQSGNGQILARPFRFLSRWFGIPTNQTDVVILSLIGGYPVGARILAQRVHSGQLDCDTASRMLAFCVHASPAFLYTGVGIGVFHDTRVGGILLFSSVVAFLVTGICSQIGFRKEKMCAVSSIPKKTPFAVSLVSSVKSGVQSMALICGSVLLFAAFLPIIRLLLASVVSDKVSAFICGVFEVCSGCSTLSSGCFSNPIPVAAFFSSFGGICIFLQIAAMLYRSGISMKRMLFFRIIYTAVATGTTALFSSMLAEKSVESMAVFDGVALYGTSVSPFAVGFLLLLIILLLFFSVHPVTIKIRKCIPAKKEK